ncbi:hypothetical protein BDW62DRAFT_185845 [Aspergillus aurantiobrunneus]
MVLITVRNKTILHNEAITSEYLGPRKRTPSSYSKLPESMSSSLSFLHHHRNSPWWPLNSRFSPPLTPKTIRRIESFPFVKTRPAFSLNTSQYLFSPSRDLQLKVLCRLRLRISLCTSSYPTDLEPCQLLTVLRRNMSWFAYLPQARLLKLTASDPQTRRSFDPALLATLDFNEGDLVCNAYRVKLHTDDTVEFEFQFGVQGRIVVSVEVKEEEVVFP